jgi:hypothetical protein
LSDRIAERERLAKLGVIIHSSAYVKQLKDEKLKTKKIVNCLTRIYDAGPIDLLLLFRRYFGAFQAYMMEISHKYMHAIGVDCTSPDWDYIMQQLKDIYPSLFDGDVEGWDKCILSCLQKAIINAINRFYAKYDKTWDPNDDIVRRTLFEENINTWALVFAEIILVNVGVPSGNFMTASGNSILNRALIMAWAIMTIDDLTYEEFIDFIKTVLMGDDHVVRVKKEVQDVLNGNSLRDWFRKHGVNYTPASKDDGDNFKFRNIEEIEFVKMNNKILTDGTIVAIPMIICINSGIQYLKAPLGTQEILLQNLCDGFSYQMFWHGEELYERYRQKMIEIAEEHNITIAFASYVERYFTFVKKFNSSLPGYEPSSMRPIIKLPLEEAGGIYIEDTFNVEGEAAKAADLTKVFIEGPYEVQSGTLDNVKDLMADLVEASEALPIAGDTPVLDEAKQAQKPVTEYEVGDAEWSYTNLAEKRFFLETVTYSSTHAPGDILAVWGVPLQMVSNCQQRIPFTKFKFWKGNAGLKLIINKNPFQSGMIVVWWAPMVEPSLTGSGTQIPGNNLTRATGMRHMLIDIQSTSSSVEFEVPFSYLLGALPLDYGPTSITGSCMGSIGISAVTPLRVGTNTTTTLSINVHSYFPNSKFMVPIIDESCDAPSRGHELIPNSDLPGHFVHQGGHVSKSTEITNIIIGDNNATSEEIGGDTYEQGTRLQASYQVGGADFDRLLTNFHPVPVELNTHASQNKVAQPIAADPLGPSLKEQPICREHVFGTPVDEMSFNTLLSTWQYMKTIQWDVAKVAGDTLGVLPISICPLFAERTVETGVPATYMDFLSTMHAYWKGPIEYKVHIIASGMISGSLIAAARYGNYDTIGSSIVGATTQYYSVLSLDQTSRSMEIELVNPTNYPYFKTSAKKFADMTLEEKRENLPGTFTLTVQNPLVVGAGAPNVVDVVIFVRAPKVRFFQRKRASAVVPSLVLEGLRRDGVSLQSKRAAIAAKRAKAEKEALEFDNAVVVSDFEVQSGRAYNPAMKPPSNSSTPAGKVATNRVTLGKTFQPDEAHNLLSFTSLRTHIKQFYGYLKADVVSGTFFVEDMFYISFLGQFAGIYSMWRGVSLLKVVSANPDDVIRVTYDPHDTQVTDNFDVAGDSCYKGLIYAGAPARVFAIPFVTQYKFLLTPESGFNTSDPDFATPGSLYYNSELGSEIYPFFSLGDEFRFGGLIGVPLMQMDPNNL